MTQHRMSRRNFLTTSAVLSGILLGTTLRRPFSPFLNLEPYVDLDPTASFAGKAEITFARLSERFAIQATPAFKEHSPLRAEDAPGATLWPYTSVVAALNSLAALPRKKPTYEKDLRAAVEGLGAFYDATANPPGYDSYPRALGGGQKYYDDNAWVGLEYVRAYQNLGDAVYLTKAEEALRFTLSGWSDAMGGGIYWRQGDDSSKNTASNGPAAVLALQLYQLTGKSEYLDWGVRILDWLKGLKANESGVYWDNLRKNGDIDRQTFTYNAGTVIHANVLRYNITGEESHLREARGIALASYAYFAPARAAWQPRLFPATPWFNAVLARGYASLAAVDSAGRVSMQGLRDYLVYAWEHARGTDGLFSPEPGGSGRDDAHRWILDQAGMVEMFALVA